MSTSGYTAVVSPTPEALGVLRPLDAAGVRVTGGFWSTRLTTNRERNIPHGLRQLEASGALENLRRASRGTGEYAGASDDAGITLPFLDSDVYKWLEAVGWELGRAHDPALTAAADEVISIVEAAQQPDGYLNSFVQLTHGRPFSDLQWGHELYCAGHLLQAAVAWQRALGDQRLMEVGLRLVGRIDAGLGPAAREAIDGHPEIEMALVEVYRTTGDERCLILARRMVELRGHGLLGAGRLGSEYWQDHSPVREADTVAGHAVRQMYLDCGVVDVAVETADVDLLATVERRWADMWATRTHLTGALGSRHRDEAFGDPFELPPDRAYAETCAAIGSVMLAWRLLLATGKARYGDAIERTMYNAVLPGVGLDGATFFYVNPLRVRDRIEAAATRGLRGRAPWYPCACCPPNLMRFMSSFEHILAARSGDGLTVHQYASCSIEMSMAGGPVAIDLDTGYPWDGGLELAIRASPATAWTLAWRVPGWCRTSAAQIDGMPAEPEVRLGIASLTRVWTPGERLMLDFALPARVTHPDPRIDSLRGTVAIERGPLVYCVEQTDLPKSGDLDSLRVPVGAQVQLAPVRPSGLPEEIVTLAVPMLADSPVPQAWPYAEEPPKSQHTPEALVVPVIPYFTWANREIGPMRVWLPEADDSQVEESAPK
jgi:uncharacterized protein